MSKNEIKLKRKVIILAGVQYLDASFGSGDNVTLDFDVRDCTVVDHRALHDLENVQKHMTYKITIEPCPAPSQEGEQG